jgi:DNA-binding CsgD family transcriptional regulator/PAS domain-containing protein
MDAYDRLVGSIYDCAINPELWPRTLTSLRDHMGAAYVMVGFSDLSPLASGGIPINIFRHSPWDAERLQELAQTMMIVPGGARIFETEIDLSWTQLGAVSEKEFHKSEFYLTWVKPQRLRDCLVTKYLKRPALLGMVSLTVSEDRPLISAHECEFIERLSPHFRRAMMINDIADKGRLALTLYKKILDNLTVATFLVGAGRRIVFCNASAEQMLSGGNFLKSSSRVLTASRGNGAAAALNEAMDRAIKGDSQLGLAGIGVPLTGLDDDRVAAYVLPVHGDDLRGDLGEGHAAVFIARRSEQQPAMIEILRTVFDLTLQEARVGALIAKGDNPAVISEVMDISINTVRTHLARIFAKTGTNDQIGLAATVNALIPPVE